MNLDKSLNDIIRSKPRERRGRGRRSQPYQRKNYGVRRVRKIRKRSYGSDSLTELKVSASTDPKKLAGKINNIVLNGDPPQIFAIGVNSTNQLVKALAISRRNVRYEKIDLLVQPRFQRSDDIAHQDADAFIFSLRKGPARRPRVHSTVLKVASSSDDGKLAGAIAKRIRTGERLVLESIGPIAACIGVKAIVHSRKFLIDDGMDLGFRPEFGTFDVNGEEQTGLRLHLFASQT